MAICPSCGAALPEGSRFCTECGAKIEAAAPAMQSEFTVDLPEAPAIPETPPMPEAPSMELYEMPVSEKPDVPYQPSQPTEAPAYTAPAPAVAAAAPAAAAPVPVYTAPAAPAEDPDKPGKKSKYAPMTAWGMAIEWILMSIPVVGFILMILWSCGVCRKIARRNLARAYLIILIIGIVLAIVTALLARFVFADTLTAIVEQLLPGYTLQWG